MTPAARLAGAIEVLTDIVDRRRPASDAMKDWGLSHRFAGSGDRAGISGLVFDALRKRSSSAYLLGEEGARAVLLGALKQTRGFSIEGIEKLCTGDKYGAAALSEHERERLTSATLEGAPSHVRADVPEWLAPLLSAALGDSFVAEGQALAERAPVDIRVNTLKAERPEILEALKTYGAEPTPHAPQGVRITVREDGRAPPIQSEPTFLKGGIEIQDEGSQLAALLAGKKLRGQVLDLCAGGGGKALALAAMMENQGQIFATDSDIRRLAPIHDRLKRAGVHNVQVFTPRAGVDALVGMEGKCDLVFVDAPCTGAGAWRRNPDAKWRLRPNALEMRKREQDAVLDQAARAVKSGGRLHYVTCSLLREENEDRIAAFVERNPGFLPVEAGKMAGDAGLPSLARHASKLGPGLRLSPLATATDGFYICALARL